MENVSLLSVLMAMSSDLMELVYQNVVKTKNIQSKMTDANASRTTLWLVMLAFNVLQEPFTTSEWWHAILYVVLMPYSKMEDVSVTQDTMLSVEDVKHAQKAQHMMKKVKLVKAYALLMKFLMDKNVYVHQITIISTTDVKNVLPKQLITDYLEDVTA